MPAVMRLVKMTASEWDAALQGMNFADVSNQNVRGLR